MNHKVIQFQVSVENNEVFYTILDSSGRIFETRMEEGKRVWREVKVPRHLAPPRSRLESQLQGMRKLQELATKTYPSY